MKKKILLILVCVISAISLITVNAEDGVYYPTLMKIKSKAKTSAEVQIYSKNGEFVHSGIFYKQKINGYWALCLAMGKHSRSDFAFKKIENVEKYFNDSITLYQIERAYEFIYRYNDLQKEDPEGFNLVYTIAQLYTWIVLNPSIDIYDRRDSLKYSTYSAYCAAFLDVGDKDKKCGIGEEDYNFVESGRMQLHPDTTFSYMINFYIGKLFETLPSTTRKYAVYVSDVPNSQPLFGTYGKNSTTTPPTEPGTTPEECELNIKSNTPSSCYDDTTDGYITNKTDWSCLYKRIKANDAKTTEYLVDDTNKYCKVYCMDTVESSLPESGVRVDQGKYLTVGMINFNINNISPITYNGTRECRIASSAGDIGTIDINLFKNDIAIANNNVTSAIATYKKAQTDLANIKEASAGEWTTSIKCKTSYSTTEIEDQCKSEVSTALAGKKKNEEYYQKQLNECISKKDTCKTYYQERTWSVPRDGSLNWVELEGTGPNKDSKISEYEGKLNNARNNYNNAVSARSLLISQFNSCSTTLPNSIKYDEFNPNVSIWYDEPVYGGDNIQLISSISENRNVSLYKTGSGATTTGDKTSTSNLNSYAFNTRYYNGTNESVRTESVQYANWWEVNYNKNYDYTLPNNFYRYVEKGSGQSVHNMTNYKIEYVDIGFSNLPIHYSTDPGDYEYQLTTDTLGTGNKFNTDYGVPNTYACDYTVNCDDTIQNNSLTGFKADCPSTSTNITGSGLNVVYRTISLYSKEKAFPGLNGTGRTPGDNWNDNNLINTYIVNNRGVTDYEVYHLDPLYEIELTPSMMKIFRQYNKTKNREVITMYSSNSAATTGIAGYSDFSNMSCNSDGTHCVSSLLRGNVTGYTQIKVTGCAMSNSGIYGNCGSNNQAW